MARRRRGQPVHGWLILDKPQDLTSTQAVSIVRRLYDAQKAGHGGTLDPLATGLLPIALGEATKTVPYVMDGTKTYRFTVTWGAETDSCDSEGEVTETTDARPTKEQIEALLPEFIGVISQTPPRFSAIKVKGQRAYDLAREGQDFELKSREVEIEELRLISADNEDQAAFEVVCGKGTYVRSLARDMGRKLGCLGHISQLRRTCVGSFCESDMIPLEKLEEIRHKDADREALMDCLMPVATALDDIPALAIDRKAAIDLRQGRPVLLRGGDAPVSQAVVLALWQSTPVALASVEKGMLKPFRVFNFNNQPS